MFALLPDDHVVAFMMVLQESNQLKKKQVGNKKEVGNNYTLHSLPVCVLRVIVEMARTHFLHKVYKELRGVRKLLGCV